MAPREPQIPTRSYFVEQDFIGAAIVQFRAARRGMVRHRLGAFEGSGVCQIIRNAGGAEGVIADLDFDAGRTGPPLDHEVRVGLRHAMRLAGRPLHGSEQWRVLLADAGRTSPDPLIDAPCLSTGQHLGLCETCSGCANC